MPYPHLHKHRNFIFSDWAARPQAILLLTLVKLQKDLIETLNNSHQFIAKIQRLMPKANLQQQYELQQMMQDVEQQLKEHNIEGKIRDTGEKIKLLQSLKSID